MKDDGLYLSNIKECIERIEFYTRDGKEVFMRTIMIQDAVIRNFEIMGEATKRGGLYPCWLRAERTEGITCYPYNFFLPLPSALCPLPSSGQVPSKLRKSSGKWYLSPKLSNNGPRAPNLTTLTEAANILTRLR
jgi:Protein of unknown function DUF86